MITPQQIAQLKQRAQHVSRHAYCPQSDFPVGAAVLSETGDIFVGCNVENRSFGLTICAERNAVFQAVAGGAKRISAVVIYTPTPTPTSPCGACRQVIHELGPDAIVTSVCDGEAEQFWTIAELLPAPFDIVEPQDA